jgi:hypothetical protein
MYYIMFRLFGEILALTLLEARVLLVDYEQLALPAYDLAIGAALLDGCSNLHFGRLYR